ncbi:MAG: tetratricopeptide repeat protein [Bacteroidia bacterium]|nr:tetratricopeptide repeat protein [Bacteroidia bacterium]
MNLSRIELLIGQRRYDMAEKEIRQQMGDFPDNPLVRSYLGISLLGQGRVEDAKKEVEHAIGLAPDFSFAHGLLSRIYYQEGKTKEALASVEEAIRIDPSDANQFVHLAYIQFSRNKWDEALAAAEQGLSLDPEHVDGINIRARILVKLGRSPEASAAFDASMNKNPENAYTHINRGWALLEEGRYDEALKHFKEGVRLDPDNEVARSGLVEGLKAKYWIYRAYLKFAFWMENMNSGLRWAMMIGFILVANSLPMIMPFYLALIFFSWFSSILFNILLRFNSYGKYALSEEQIRYSNIFASLLGVGVVGLITGLAANIPLAENIGIVCLGLLFPVTGTFSKSRKSSRQKSLWMTYGFVLTGLAFILTSFLGMEIASVFFAVFAYGIMLYTFVIAFLP